MATITNHSGQAMAFYVKHGKTGHKVADLRPGETADLDLLDRNAPYVKAREQVGAISIKGSRDTTVKDPVAAARVTAEPKGA